MATKGEMVRALAEGFHLNPNKVEAMTRALARVGLRSPGGRGRAAAHMNGEDIFNLTLALVMGLETKDAPEAISHLTQLDLVFGSLFKDEHIQWEVSKGGGLQKPLLAALNRLPVSGLKMSQTFGAFCGHWLDDGFGDEAQGFSNAKVSVEVSTNGPHALFSHQSEEGDLKIWFGIKPSEIPSPEWERRTVISDGLFQKLSVLANGNGGGKL